MNNILLSGGRRSDQVEMSQFSTYNDAMDEDMERFHIDESAIQDDLKKFSAVLGRLEDAHRESQVLTNAKALRALRQQMLKDMDQIGILARTIKTKIEALDRANAENRRKPHGAPGSVAERTRTNRTNFLKTKLKDLTTKFMSFKEKIQKDYYEVVERRVFTVTGQKPDEGMVERLIEEGRGDEIFQAAVQGQGRDQILGTIAEIEERHESIKDIEVKMRELNQIFVDMAMLVESQGELLNDIEKNVDQAHTYVGQGTKQLVTARRLQLNTRKWVCIGITIVLIIVVIIIIVVVPKR